jgi:phospholipase/carboxylesterase
MQLMHTAHVPAGEGPFPTIFALHGWGASAHDLLGLAPYLHGGQALVLCPQGPIELPVGPGITGYGWFPIRMGRPPDPEEFQRGAALLREFLEAAPERYPIDRRHQVLLGFSQGGVMAYDLALRDPARFAGLAALSSWLPEPLAAGIERREELGTLPTLVVHGSKDPMIPVARAHESVEQLRALGVAPVYREYEMEHGIGPEALRDLVRWLEEKVLNPILLA